MLYHHRKNIISTTHIELRKRYAGSFIGSSWIVLQPLLFLSIYLFVFLVVFQAKFPGYSELDYVVYVFAGLVPYIAFMETLTLATGSIRQNIHLIRNLMLPLELVPARVVAMVMVTQLIGLGMVLFLSAVNGSLSMNLFLLPLALIVQMLFLLGLAWAFAAAGVFAPDLGYFVNHFVLLLMFVSPIAFRLDMVPPEYFFAIELNPIYYMTELFRVSIIADHPVNTRVMITGVLGSLFIYAMGSIFFNRFRKVLVDYE